jgi:dethiobiotin synthetase
MNKHTAFFISGTSTGIGKTYISSLLVKAFGFSGLVSYMKPVQTGCNFPDASDADLSFIKQHASPVFTETITDHTPYCFDTPCSPHLAASLSNASIDISVIVRSYHKILSHVNTLIVEGAGGLLVPLSETVSTLDMIKLLNIPVILVTTPNLGTLNHTFLSVNQLRTSGVTLAGVIMNNPDNKQLDFMYSDNAHMIRRYIAPVPFIEIPFGAENNEQLEAFCKRIRPL